MRKYPTPKGKRGNTLPVKVTASSSPEVAISVVTSVPLANETALSLPGEPVAPPHSETTSVKLDATPTATDVTTTASSETSHQSQPIVGSSSPNAAPLKSMAAIPSSQGAVPVKTQETETVAIHDTDTSTNQRGADEKQHFTTQSGATESDIDQAKPMTILSFGNGFQMKVVKNGTKYFQQRYCLGGNGGDKNLGKYPKMSFAQAQVEAEKIREMVEQTRYSKNMSAFNAKLKKPKSKKKSTNEEAHIFKGLDQAGQFIRDLFGNKTLDEEMRIAIWLLMLVPSKQSELFLAKWQHINFNASLWVVNCEELIKFGKIRHIKPKLAFLSQLAMNELSKLKQLTGSGDYLFPRLSKPDRDRVLTKSIETIGFNYPADPNVFRSFFGVMSRRLSFYRIEFIEDMMAHTDGNGAINNDPYYVQQRHEFAEWWGRYLIKLCDTANTQQSQSTKSNTHTFNRGDIF